MKSGEKEFIISPLFGAMVIQTLTNKSISEHKLWAAKKPFDWMSDEQFLNLQVRLFFEFINKSILS
jgi:dynein heavy chain